MKNSLYSSQVKYLFYLLILLSGASELFADIRVLVLNNSGGPLVRTRVDLVLGGVTKTKYSGADGRVRFLTPNAGAYVLRAERSGYTFQQSSGTVSQPSQQLSVTMTGTPPTVTLSGTVNSSLGEPIETAAITFNNHQSVVVNPATGAFSVTAPMGSEYSLRVAERDWVFISPEIRGTATGNTTVRFIGYPK